MSQETEQWLYWKPGDPEETKREIMRRHIDTGLDGQLRELLATFGQVEAIAIRRKQ